jgi:hypothetical protein
MTHLCEDATDYIDWGDTLTQYATIWGSDTTDNSYREFLKSEQVAANKVAFKELRHATQHQNITRLNMSNSSRQNLKGRYWWKGHK